MALKTVSKIDPSWKGVDYKIYEVDGMFATLKEFADYFGVDPVQVSDYMLEGVSIQDALCMADKGKKRTVRCDKGTTHPGTVKKKSIKLLTKPKDKKAEFKNAMEEARTSARNDVSESKADVKKLVAGMNSVATKAVTDVQDLGDVIVITTTTTVVYRKDGVK